MDAQLIEQLDQRRSKYLLWQTISFGIFFAGIIAGPYLTGKVWIGVISCLTGLGGVLFFVATLKSNRNERWIKSSPQLREALNNELVRLYGYKSLMWSFYSTLATAAILYFISAWIPALPTRLVCLVIIYVACLTLMIARLVYLRR